MNEDRQGKAESGKPKAESEKSFPESVLDDPRLVLLAGSRLDAGVIVCEREGHWALAIGRSLPSGVKVHQTRSLPECSEVLAESPASFVVMEICRDNVERLIKHLARWQHDYPLARLTVVGDRETLSLEGLVREAGAVHFAVALRDSPAIAAIARRHLAMVPPRPRDFYDQLWDRLPWTATGRSPNLEFANSQTENTEAPIDRKPADEGSR
jgi:hypothetical protein